MRFWDSSAILPLILEEAASGLMRECYRSDRDMLVWWGSLIECHSGLARRERGGAIPGEIRSQASQALHELSLHWTEVEPVTGVREVALRLLGSHDLRSADALQLAAAVVSSADEPRRLDFVCLDRRLAQAAVKEGLNVLGEE
jgi:predicted nucleic acid-binding protein